jgi:putative FmdB family regulatory protein
VPIYDYICSSCATRTEVIHGIDAPGPRFCPACGADGTLRKAFVAPTVHFKGSGWAKKDRSSSGGARSRSGSSAPSNEGDGSPAPSNGSSGETAKEPKPASGSEPAKGAAGPSAPASDGS